jgi:hypothetical protein
MHNWTNVFNRRSDNLGGYLPLEQEDCEDAERYFDCCLPQIYARGSVEEDRDRVDEL